jgi:hypothetical protein
MRHINANDASASQLPATTSNATRSFKLARTISGAALPAHPLLHGNAGACGFLSGAGG